MPFALAPFLVQLVVGIGLQMVGYLIMGKPKQSRPDAAAEMEGPQVATGMPMPVVFGEVTVDVAILWYGDKTTRTYEVKS